ncbi:hypothetical protein [Marinobacter halodurans]|nr:hypothetical protein [Marinobacter halodurans]
MGMFDLPPGVTENEKIFGFVFEKGKNAAKAPLKIVHDERGFEGGIAGQ